MYKILTPDLVRKDGFSFLGSYPRMDFITLNLSQNEM